MPWSVDCRLLRGLKTPLSDRLLQPGTPRNRRGINTARRAAAWIDGEVVMGRSGRRADGVRSEHAEHGQDAREDAGARLLEGAEPEQVLERTAIAPVVAQLAEAVELTLAHKS